MAANMGVSSDAQVAEAEDRAAALRQFRDLARTLKIDHHTKGKFETITRSMERDAIEQVRGSFIAGTRAARYVSCTDKHLVRLLSHGQPAYPYQRYDERSAPDSPPTNRATS